MARHALFLLCIMANLLVLSPGCSVKEDRGQCPAVLNILLPAGDGEVFVSMMGPEGDPVTHRAELSGEPSQVSYPVCHEGFVLVVSTVEWKDSLITVQAGQECPELLIHRSYVHVEGEALDVRADLMKEFCSLEVFVASQYPEPSLRISGAWCGQDIEGTLVKGQFRAPLASGNTIRVPRQEDTSLMLDIMEGDTVLRSFAIGEYMAEAGYDWQAESLEDISVRVDYVHNRVQLTGKAWTQVFPIKIEL